MKSVRPLLPFLLSAALAVGGAGFVFAQATSAPPPIVVEDPAAAADIRDLNESIAERRARVTELERQMREYQAKIERAQSEGRTLEDQLDLLANRLEKANVDIETAREEMDLVHAEITVVDRQIADVEARVNRQKVLIADLLRRMDSYDNDLTLQMLFGSESFGELFDRLHQLERLNADLADALRRAKVGKEQLVAARAEKDTKRRRLEELDAQLVAARSQFEQEAAAKESLLAVTQSSENQFRTLLLELRQEQQNLNSEVARLQTQLERRLHEGGEADTGPMTWPVNPAYRGISTYFNDPTYPFRHLFEHSGLDIPQAQGSPVKAATSGYVAWVRVGSMYGNYIMIVHADGLATLYAHLSRPLVQPDQFVARGETIALSGGLAGAPGSGLSTGPHLHFEVRKNGIPVNPIPYLSPR